MFRKMTTLVLAAALGAGSAGRTQVLSQEGQGKPMPTPDEMMQMWEKLSTPGPQHAEFQEAVGNWNTEMKWWMGPGDPQVSAGTSQMELLLAGRYLKESYKCDMQGKPFEGIAVVGYDNYKKKYVTTWIDSMSTGIMMMEGTRDEATRPRP